LYRNGYLKRFNKNFNKYYQRQKFPPLYFPSGDFYTFWYKSFKKHGIIYGPKIKPLFYKKAEVSLYIDTIFDLFECEMTMKVRHDMETMKDHLEQLNDQEHEIYKVLSKSIYQKHNQ